MWILIFESLKNNTKKIGTIIFLYYFAFLQHKV